MSFERFAAAVAQTISAEERGAAAATGGAFAFGLGFGTDLLG